MTGNREEIARLMEFAMVHADAAEEVRCRLGMQGIS
jgi:hypothetical protein